MQSLGSERPAMVLPQQKVQEEHHGMPKHRVSLPASKVRKTHRGNTTFRYDLDAKKLTDRGHTLGKGISFLFPTHSQL